MARTLHPNPAQPVFIAPEDPKRKLIATIVICLGALLTGLTVADQAAEVETYRYSAYVMGVALAAAFIVEGSGGVRSLVRVDIVALFGLYFLTFAEFLHPNVRVLYDQYTGAADFSCQLTVIGFAFLAIGRHFPLPFSMGIGKTSLPEMPARNVFLLFLALFLLGFFWIFISVHFNPVTLAKSLVAERFNRPWQRGSLGGWTSFLTELTLLLHPMSALAGYIFSQSDKFSVARRATVGGIMAFVLAFDIADGSRNALLIHAGLMMACYLIASRKARSMRIVLLGVSAATALLAVSYLMLEFRTSGLTNYLNASNMSRPVNAVDPSASTFMLDNNLVSIARVVQIYPQSYPFPGTDVVLQIFTKWIPRALWRGKPEGWTNSIEDVLGIGDAYTLAVTFVGEAYLIAGVPSLVVVSFLLGSLAAAWTKVGLAARTNLDLIYYSTGFFAAMLSMRSVQWISIAVVPVVALYVIGRMLNRPRKGMRSVVAASGSTRS